MQVSKKFIEDFLHFTAESTRWCCEESEQATVKISKSIDYLLRETERVSRLSPAGLEAVKNLRSHLQSPDAHRNRKALRDIVSSIKSRVADNQDMQRMIYPLLEVLQFQDLFRQQMENRVKMLQIWLDERDRVLKSGKFGGSERKAWGEKLAKAGAMKAERQVVKNYIPEVDLPQEGNDQTLFF